MIQIIFTYKERYQVLILSM
uniref:Uncharacterized protein n=1 Tax=Heterorhabditis bacteriophora TaxID=37862 RepID=A0A1I7W692_HETBA